MVMVFNVQEELKWKHKFYRSHGKVNINKNLLLIIMVIRFGDVFGIDQRKGSEHTVCFVIIFCNLWN